MPTPDLEELKRIAEVEYSDIVTSAHFITQLYKQS